MNKPLLISITILTCLLIYYLFVSPDHKANSKKSIISLDKKTTISKISNIEINAIQHFIKKRSSYNPDLAFFIDLKIPSGRNRFFVYDFNAQKIIDNGLVAHGRGSEVGKSGKLKFSNIENSHATSLGKYRIGKSYQGKFGKAYKLYGLDSSNSNALVRNIVLHKYYEVPHKEQDKDICTSLGCPMVNQHFFSRIEKIIDNSKKNIVLSIYY